MNDIKILEFALIEKERLIKEIDYLNKEINNLNNQWTKLNNGLELFNYVIDSIKEKNETMEEL